MKILIAACNAKYIHSNLAVYNLKAYAQAYSEHLVLKEYTINQQTDDILRDIYLEQPDMVCVSCYIWNISFVKDLMDDLRKILPDVPFWAGGPEVSFDAEEFLEKNPVFTGVMVGEGEATFLELVRYYVEGKGSLSQIKGIAYRRETCVSEEGNSQSDEKNGSVQSESQICHNGWRELLDLSTVPFAYEDLSDFRNRIIYYESSRGCPFSCSYCLSSVDKKLRFRNLELVKKELQFFIDHQVPQVKFVDRTFNCRHEHAMEIWRYITEHDNGITNFHFEISADLLREEELALMADMRPGLIQLEIGVQSTNPQTIKAIRRTMNLEKLKRATAMVHSYGNIHQHLDLIAGLPYEGYESFRNSFNEVYAMKPDQLQLGFLKVLKGSYMKEMVPEYKIQYQTKEPYEVLSTNWLTYGEILKLKMVESMVEVYYNSGQFQSTLEYLLPYFADAFSFYEELGAFYRKKGYGEVSHSRMRRYEILLEFLEGCTEENSGVHMERIKNTGKVSEEENLEQAGISVEEAAERMVFDLYLRENLKSRPSFAGNQKPYEKAIWEYRRANRIPKTAHIEIFQNGRAVLFDYTKRSPLTNNAYTEEITIENVRRGEEDGNV